jgi:hypothetical protein
MLCKRCCTVMYTAVLQWLPTGVSFSRTMPAADVHLSLRMPLSSAAVSSVRPAA